DAFRRHDPLRPATVELVLAADFLAGMRDEVDLLDQAALIVGGNKGVSVAHADRDVVDAYSAGTAKRELARLAETDHVRIAPLIDLDASDEEFIREPEVIDVAQIV